MDGEREEIVLNGQRVKSDSPEAQEVIRRREECRKRGVPYPHILVDDYYEYPFFFWGKTPYHAETYELMRPSAAARQRPVELPPDFEIDGDISIPGETPNQFRMYQIYRDLGPERKLSDVLKIAGIKGSQTTKIKGWCIRYRWDERCAAFDLGMEAERRRAAQDLVQQQIRTELEHRDTYLKNEWNVVELGFKVVKEMLNYPVVEVKEQTISKDGKTIVTIWQPGKWTMATVASLIDALAKIGRLNTGLITSNSGSRMDAQSAQNDRDRERQQAEVRSSEDEAMHQYASLKAEEAYFAACDEWRAKRAQEMGEKAPVPRLQARVA